MLKRRGTRPCRPKWLYVIVFLDNLSVERIFQTFPESKVPRPIHFFSGDATRPHHASNASMLKLSSHLDPFGYMVASRAQRGPLHVVKRSRIALTARQNPHHNPFSESPLRIFHVSRLFANSNSNLSRKHFAQPLLHLSLHINIHAHPNAPKPGNPKEKKPSTFWNSALHHYTTRCAH